MLFVGGHVYDTSGTQSVVSHDRYEAGKCTHVRHRLEREAQSPSPSQKRRARLMGLCSKQWQFWCLVAKEEIPGSHSRLWLLSPGLSLADGPTEGWFRKDQISRVLVGLVPAKGGYLRRASTHARGRC